MSGGEATNILTYTLVAIAGMFFAGQFTQNLFTPQTTVPLSGIDAMSFGILMAVAEEQFFRGALLNFLLARLGTLPAIAGSATIFYIYHFFTYPANQGALLYVLAGGLLLAFVTVKTGRISCAILAHCTNNLLALI